MAEGAARRTTRSSHDDLHAPPALPDRAAAHGLDQLPQRAGDGRDPRRPHQHRARGVRPSSPLDPDPLGRHDRQRVAVGGAPGRARPQAARRRHLHHGAAGLPHASLAARGRPDHPYRLHRPVQRAAPVPARSRLSSVQGQGRRTGDAQALEIEVKEARGADQGQADAKMPEEAHRLQRQRLLVAPPRALVARHALARLVLLGDQVGAAADADCGVLLELQAYADEPDQQADHADGEETDADHEGEDDNAGDQPTAGGDRESDRPATHRRYFGPSMPAAFRPAIAALS